MTLKKYELAALVTIVFLILTACSGVFETETKITDTQHTEFLITDSPLLYIDTYEDYLSLLESTELPADFVEYSCLNCFGSFDGFVDISGPLNRYNCYMYSFVDTNNFSYYAYVSRENKLEIETVLSQDYINLADMRILPSNLTGKYTMNGFTYYYVSGRLFAIGWSNEELYYSVGFDVKKFSDYPIEALTPLALLVNIRDESISFMNELLGSNE